MKDTKKASVQSVPLPFCRCSVCGVVGVGWGSGVLACSMAARARIARQSGEAAMDVGVV